MSKKWRNAAALVQHANSDDVLTRTLIKQGAWQKELGPLDKTAALMHSARIPPGASNIGLARPTCRVARSDLADIVRPSQPDPTAAQSTGSRCA